MLQRGYSAGEMLDYLIGYHHLFLAMRTCLGEQQSIPGRLGA